MSLESKKNIRITGKIFPDLSFHFKAPKKREKFTFKIYHLKLLKNAQKKITYAIAAFNSSNTAQNKY